MYKKIWWLNPVAIYTLLMVLVILSYRIPEIQIYNNYHMKKGVTFDVLALHIIAYLIFVCGYLVSKKILIKGKFFKKTHAQYMSFNSLYKAYKLLTNICFVSYFIWYVNFFRINGLSILLNFKSLAGISQVMYIMRNNSGRISGITTFTEVAMLSVPLGIYLIMKNKQSNYNKKIRREIIIIFFLAIFRTVSFSERLAIIELIVPSIVMYLSLTKNKNIKMFVIFGPLFGIIMLLIIFAIFEYSRSWLRHYIRYYDSYLDFVIQRVTAYYTNAINTEGLYINYGEFSYLPYRSIEWLWQLPGFKSIYNAIAPVNVPIMFNTVLSRYGNPEYNNPGGLLTLYYDLGIFFPIAQFVFGFIIGRIYKQFKDNCFIANIFYPFVFMCMIELPRYFSFGSNRAFFVYIGIIIIYLLIRVEQEEKNVFFCNNSNIQGRTYSFRQSNSKRFITN